MEDRIDDYIDKIEEQRDAELSAIDAQIDALKEQNDELESQISLQEALDNIAKARQQKAIVLTENGWQEVEDENAISQAQAEYDTLLRQQQYEEQLSNLENYRDQVESEYDAQIKIYEDYRDQFGVMVDSYENEQDRLLAEQLTGLDMENDMWITRLSNLSSFVNKYNSLQAQLGTANTSTTVNTSGSGSSGGTSTSTTVSKPSMGAQPWKKRMAYATGVDSVSEDQMAFVGDAPNTEMVIGSKLNGTLMDLSKGVGVVNAESTKTFAGILNSIGKYAGLSGNVGEVVNNSSSSRSISIGNISLPSVRDGEGFINYLENYELQMTQESFA